MGKRINSVPVILAFIVACGCMFDTPGVFSHEDKDGGCMLKGQAAWPPELEFFDDSRKACDLIEKYTYDKTQWRLSGPGERR